jgi:hypothetical protein
MTRSRVIAVALFVVVLSGCLSGCAVRAEHHAHTIDDDSVPFGLLDSNAPPLAPSTTSDTTALVTACFVDGGRLGVVTVALERPVRLGDVVDALASPPDDARVAWRTEIGEPSIVHSVRLEAGTAHVDLVAGVNDLGADDQLLAVAQLVCTLTGRPGVGQVSFTLDGSPVDVPRSDGSLTDEPVSRDDYADLLG